MGKPDTEPVGESLGKLVGEPVGKPAGKSVGEPVGKTDAEPVGKPVGKADPELVDELEDKPDTESDGEPYQLFNKSRPVIGGKLRSEVGSEPVDKVPLRKSTLVSRVGVIGLGIE